MAELDSLYDRIGGRIAVSETVQLFYDKVLEDENLSPFFEGVDMDRLNAIQVAFVSMAFGGPKEYSGKDLRSAHQHLVEQMGLSDVHFDLVKQYLAESMQTLGVDEDFIAEAAAIVESVRNDILCK